MKHFLFFISSTLLALHAFSQAEYTLPTGGCATASMANRYQGKSIILGTSMDGTIIYAVNNKLSSKLSAPFKFSMEAGVNYTLSIIFDTARKNNKLPRPAAWGTLKAGGQVIQTLEKKTGTHLFFAISPIAQKQEVTVNLQGEIYYGTDSLKREDVCAISYVIKKTQMSSTIKMPTEKPTIVPATMPGNKNEVFSSWAEAKSKLNWQFLEAKNDRVTRSITNGNLVVANLATTYQWTQAITDYKPFPAYWFYEADLNLLSGKNTQAENGLMLTARYAGDEYKFLFLVNANEQTWVFGMFNTATQSWTNLHPTTNGKKPFSATINKSVAGKDFTSNKLSLYREGKKLLLYINGTEIASFNTDTTYMLNYLTGIGIAGQGVHGYYVSNPVFWKLE